MSCLAILLIKDALSVQRRRCGSGASPTHAATSPLYAAPCTPCLNSIQSAPCTLCCPLYSMPVLYVRYPPFSMLPPHSMLLACPIGSVRRPCAVCSTVYCPSTVCCSYAPSARYDALVLCAVGMPVPLDKASHTPKCPRVALRKQGFHLDGPSGSWMEDVGVGWRSSGRRGGVT